jgi:hypothetical protein
VAPKAYRELRDQLDTGEIVLFSGKGRLSAGIKWFTGSKWSHVGMVLRKPAHDMVFLWESTTLSNLKDAEDGWAKRSVQLVFLSQRLPTYDGDITIRRFVDVPPCRGGKTSVTRSRPESRRLAPGEGHG